MKNPINRIHPIANPPNCSKIDLIMSAHFSFVAERIHLIEAEPS